MVIRIILIGVNYKNYNWAFIQFLNTYALADIVPASQDGKVYITRDYGVSKSIFCFWWLFAVGFTFIPFIGGIIGIIIQVFCLIKIYSFVYAIYDDKQESEETIIAILSSIIPIIFLLKGSTYFGKTPKYRY